VASYAGDGNNKPAASGASDEPETVDKASPAIVTTASPTGTIFAGTTPPTLKDTAVVSGGYYPTGTVKFYLFAPGVTPTYNSTTGLPNDAIYSENGTVSYNATSHQYVASTSIGYSQETAPGTYQWEAFYLGNGNNNTAKDISNSTQEQVTIADQVAKNEAATMGFWANTNGQTLLGTYKGTGTSGSGSTAGAAGLSLGYWLATTYPHLFGNLSGDTGTQIAAYFLKVKAAASGSTWNTYAQALTSALGVWVTTSGLGWNTNSSGPTNPKYGFQQGFGGVGLGSIFYNVGNNGTSFGVANNTNVTVNNLLAYLNCKTYRTGGTTTGLPTGLYFYSSTDTTLSNGANIVFNGINNAGDIT
jgi:hypothetical protein